MCVGDRFEIMTEHDGCQDLIRFVGIRPVGFLMWRVGSYIALKNASDCVRP